MATNPFSNPYDYQPEQDMLQSLVTEAIQWAGMDMYYLPRTRNDFDPILGADDMSSFDSAYVLEFFTETYGGFVGDREFMSKFGVEIRDQMYLSCSRERFEAEVGMVTKQHRPNEGDLIFFPLYGACFEIKYVDKRPDFYQRGILPLYRLTVELFEYSGEKFNTGIPQIDALEHTASLDQYDFTYTDENNVPLTDENYNVMLIEAGDIESIDVQADNDLLEKQVLDFLDLRQVNPFGDIQPQD